MKKWLAMFIGAGLMSISVLGHANEVENQMVILAKNYRLVMVTDSPDEFKQGLAAMKEAAIKAQQNVPDKLANEDKDSAEMKDYRHGLDILVSEIDAAKEFADAGKMDKAKQTAEQFKLTRDEYHKKYK